MDTDSKKEDVDKVVYYQDWVFKKEGFSNWILYWAVLRGRWFLLYEGGDSQSNNQLKKSIELNPGANCSLIARRKKRFPFSLINTGGTYYFKCGTELQRYHWILSVLLASTGKPRKNLPTTIPFAMQEKTVFPTWDDRHAYKFTNEKKRRPNSAPATNKRREKYNDRMENKLKVKAEKKIICEKYKYEQRENSDQRRPRGKAATHSGNVIRTQRDIDTLPVSRSKSMMDVRANLGYENDEFDQEVLSNPPISAKGKLSGPSKSMCNIPKVNIIDIEDEEDENEDQLTCDVSLKGEDVLPNMASQNEKERDLINLVTPRHSNSSTPRSSFNSKNSLQNTTNNNLSTNKTRVTSNTLRVETVQTNQKKKSEESLGIPSRPTSPYLAPKSVGLGSSKVGDMFSISNQGSFRSGFVSPRFSRHNTQSTA